MSDLTRRDLLKASLPVLASVSLGGLSLSGDDERGRARGGAGRPGEAGLRGPDTRLRCAVRRRRSALWLMSILAVGCEGSPPADAGPEDGGSALDAASVDGALASAGDGFHRVTVRQAEGDDSVWIYAASPAEGEDLPVVVYAHGQGATNAVTCGHAPTGEPMHVDVEASRRFVDAVAARGYLGVAVYYRHQGEGAPLRGAFRYRDHWIWDTRALLRAAQWARTEHGRGSDRVAFVGGSMGAFPTFFAGTTRPEWAELQEGLDIRLVIPAGMLLDHLANMRSNFHDLVPGGDDADRVAGVLGATLAAVGLRGSAARRFEITLADVESGAFRGTLAQSLHGSAIDLFADLMLRDPSTLGLAECASVTTRAFCESSCLVAVLARAFGDRPVELSEWLGDDTLSLVTYWDPADPGDPATASPGSLVALARDISPVYLDHEMATPAVLPLVSAGDQHLFPHQALTPSADAPAVARLRDMLVREGVFTPGSTPPITTDASGAPCYHDRYFDPRYPSCGFTITLDALDVAMAP